MHQLVNDHKPTKPYSTVPCPVECEHWAQCRLLASALFQPLDGQIAV